MEVSFTLFQELVQLVKCNLYSTDMQRIDICDYANRLC